LQSDVFLAAGTANVVVGLALILRLVGVSARLTARGFVVAVREALGHDVGLVVVLLGGACLVLGGWGR